MLMGATAILLEVSWELSPSSKR